MENEFTYDISDSINLMTSFEAPIYNYAMRNAAPTHAMKFAWDENKIESYYAYIDNDNGYGVKDTIFVIDNTDHFKENDLIKNLRTEEIYQIIGKTLHSIEVKRGIGTYICAILNNDILLKIGNTSIKTDIFNEKITQWNYTQKFKIISAYGNYKNEFKYFPGGISKSKIEKEKSTEFLRDIEWAFLFGKRDFDLNVSEDSWTGGLDYFLDEKMDKISTFSQNRFDSYLIDKAFAKGSKQKLMICGDLLYYHIKQLLNDPIPVPLHINSLGIYTLSYTTPLGEILYIYNHEILKSNRAFTGLGYIIDTLFLSARYTENPENTDKNGYPRLSKYHDNDFDADTNEYFAEMGLELKNLDAHCKLEITG